METEKNTTHLTMKIESDFNKLKQYCNELTKILDSRFYGVNFDSVMASNVLKACEKLYSTAQIFEADIKLNESVDATEYVNSLLCYEGDNK